MDKLPLPIKNPEIKYTKLFINNEFVDAADGTTFGTENPATGKEICQVARGKKADVDAAVAAAKAAFKRGSEWRKMKGSDRGKLLMKLGELIKRDAVYVSSLDTLDAGKSYVISYLGEATSIGDTLNYFAGWVDKYHGNTANIGDDCMAQTNIEPIGVCGAIIPWNVPIAMFIWKLAPCLAMGNTIVIKPAEQTPLIALYLASLCKEAGFPPGVVNVVTGFGYEAGDALARHMDVGKIAFTGSGVTGRKIMIASAESNLKRVSLELGGKSPNIVFPDVNLDYAVEMAHIGQFVNNGQICCAGSRIFVHEDIYDEFVARSVKRAQKGKIGDPMDYQNAHGPQVSKLQKDKILRMIEEGKEAGCTVLCGGKSVEGQDGHFIQPTVMTGLTDNMKISQDEVFGPVQQIYKFKTIEEVTERANNVTYGLAAAIFTNNINTAMTMANNIEAGTVWINCMLKMHASIPFGGYKQSGFGKDLSEYALKEYTQVKAIVTQLNTPQL